MPRKLYEEQSVKAIANSIRSNNGSSRKYKIGEMASNIKSWAPKKLIFKSFSQDLGIGPVDLTNFNCSELTTAEGLFKQLSMATQPLSPLFGKDNKIESIASIFEGMNKISKFDESDGTTYYLPEALTARKAFSGTSIGTFDKKLYAPKLKDLTYMLSDINGLYTGTFAFGDWNLPEKFDISYIFSNTKNISQFQFSSTIVSYPENVEGMFYNTTFSGSPALMLNSINFNYCKNFSKMFENSSGVLTSISIDSNNYILPDETTFERMFLNFRHNVKDFSFLKYFKVNKPKMKDMFSNCSGIERIDVRGFDLAHASDLNGLVDYSLNPNCVIFVGNEMDAIALKNTSATPGLIKIEIVGR